MAARGFCQPDKNRSFERPEHYSGFQKKKNELILNGDFSLGLKNWGNFYFFSAQNKATATVVDGVYVINVTQPGTANWHIVDQQPNIPLVQGTSYLITFDARADNPNTMDVFLAKNYGDYATYYSTTKSISGVMQKFSWAVKMAQASDPKCRFGFGFGRFTGNVYLDNVSIEKIIPTRFDELVKASGELLELFPNPASNQFELVCKSSGSSLAIIKLYNLQGQLISILWENKPLVAGQYIRVNLNDYKAGNGVYLINISTPEKSVTQKLIINRL